MADEFGPGGIDQVALRAAEAGAALEALKAPARDAADAIEEAFGRAGDSLTRSLARRRMVRCRWPNWRGRC